MVQLYSAFMTNNSETLRDTRNMSMHRDYEIGAALSDSVNKTCVKCHDFLIAFHSNFLSVTYGLRDIEVLLPT